jgi:hypothetical protein
MKFDEAKWKNEENQHQSICLLISRRNRKFFISIGNCCTMIWEEDDDKEIEDEKIRKCNWKTRNVNHDWCLKEFRQNFFEVGFGIYRKISANSDKINLNIKIVTSSLCNSTFSLSHTFLPITSCLPCISPIPPASDTLTYSWKN